MYFDVYRRPRHLPDELITAAVLFAYDYLKLPAHITTDIFFNNKRDPFLGFALWNEEEQSAEIFIYQWQSTYQLIKTLFHELAHIQQHWLEKLICSEDFAIKEWLGVEYAFTDRVTEAYNDYPWEVDAINLERELMAAFKEKLAITYPNLLTYLSESDIVDG